MRRRMPFLPLLLDAACSKENFIRNWKWLMSVSVLDIHWKIATVLYNTAFGACHRHVSQEGELPEKLSIRGYREGGQNGDGRGLNPHPPQSNL